MNWDKAKNIVIVILVLLNIGLMGLNQKEKEKYKLTQDQEKAIYQVMSQNGIGIYTDLISDFPPMRRLTVNIPVLETAQLRCAFFDEKEEIRIAVDFNKTVYQSDTKTMTLENNKVHFECPEGTGTVANYSQETATEIANQFVRRLGFGTAQYRLSDVIPDQDGFRFEYYDQFSQYKIFSSYNKVTVNQTGIVSVDCAYYEAENWMGEKVSICSPDEAILTLLQEIRKEGFRDGLRIDEMEIGYDFQDTNLIAEGSSLKLIPCYRIILNDQEDPYLINAYTNKLIK